MTRTFIVKIDSPDDIVKESDVRRAVIRYVEAEDEDAERYGAELAGYKINVEEASRAF